jgi:hypothetical protein
MNQDSYHVVREELQTEFIGVFHDSVTNNVHKSTDLVHILYIQAVMISNL